MNEGEEIRSDPEKVVARAIGDEVFWRRPGEGPEATVRPEGYALPPEEMAAVGRKWTQIPAGSSSKTGWAGPPPVRRAGAGARGRGPGLGRGPKGGAGPRKT